MAKSGFSIEPTAQTKVTLKKLATANVTPELRRALLEATQPIVPTIKREALRIPVKKSSNDSLRIAVSDIVKRQFHLSARQIMIAIQAIPKGGKSNLARVLEGEIPWDHPTFGHKPNVRQESHPFFYSTIRRYFPLIDVRVKAALIRFEGKL